MHRPVNVLNFIETIKRTNEVKQHSSPIGLRSTFITGFPGETEEQHALLKETLLNEELFIRIGVLPYSQEAGTKAAELPNQLPPDVIKRRYDELFKIQNEIAYRFNKTLLENIEEVIIDEVQNDFLVARTRYDFPEVDCSVIIPRVGKKNSRKKSPMHKQYDIKIGDIVRCKLTEAGADG